MSEPTVVVPIFNGAKSLERCLASLANWPHAPLVLVDDASTDPAIATLLASIAASRPRVKVLKATVNAGFIKSANAGAMAAGIESDILLLNSDTVATADALEAMRAALHAMPNASVCCPLSNNATFLSVPRFQQEAQLPPGLSAEDMASIVRDATGPMAPLPIPTAVGFCMWIKRDAWNSHGPLDVAYGRGYGEDDDFAQRVSSAGGTVICSPRAFVFHEGHVSFGTNATVGVQRRANWNLLVSRWPEVPSKIASFCRSNPLRPLHERIWDRVLSWPHRREMHMMHVASEWPGRFGAEILARVRTSLEFANHTIVVRAADTDALLDAIDGPVETGMRIVGLPFFEQRFPAFLSASPALNVCFYGDGWDSAKKVAHSLERRVEAK